MDTQKHAGRLESLLSLTKAAVAISFVDAPPEGLARIETSGPASCSYWRTAADGASFYTEQADHFGCPIGAHTHHVDTPPEVSEQLGEMIGTMVKLRYLREAEVPAIPTRKQAFAYAVYGPASKAPVEADVVLLVGNVRQLMLLSEAAQSIGALSTNATLGRPTCAVLPQALNSGMATSSFGCIGNRVYTGATDDEGYLAVPAALLPKLCDAVEIMVAANETLESFHKGRLSPSN